MKFVVFFILIFFNNPVFSKRSKNYQYPFTNPYMATTLNALSGFVYPYTSYTDTMLISRYPERKQLLVRKKFYRNTTFYDNVGLLCHKNQTRPLVFIIGGLSSSISEGSVKLLAYYLYQQGFHVITLDSMFLGKNALLNSTNVAFGNISSDTDDYIFYMQAALKQVKAQGTKVLDISIAGYSAGAISSLFIAKKDKEQKIFNFKTVVAINPPLELFNASMLLDKAYSVWEKYTTRRKEILMNRFFQFGYSIYQKSKTNSSPQELLSYIAQTFPYTEKQAQAYIGYNFLGDFNRNYLTGLQSFHKTKIFKNRLNKVDDGDRNFTGRIYTYKISFLSYLLNFLYPYYKKKDSKLSLESFLYQSSLASLSGFLKNSTNVFMQHNQDDILLQNPKEDMNFLEGLMKDRIIIYPRGGHLGNIWFPANIKDFLSFFAR